MDEKNRQLLLGDEAFALGALNAGLSGAYAYPGTPSTEITEYVQSHPLTTARGIHSHWSSNEKTAVEEALGMSFCGKRAIVAMKHVGMNVAADAFVNSAMTGANGGLLVVAADDPGMHSSQNEQDSRFYAEFAMTPLLEPSSQQEAYDMAAYGFELSERRQIPVVVRFVTRLSHSRGVVEVGPVADTKPLRYPDNPRQWVLMPVNSRVRNRQLIADYESFAEEAESSPYNKFLDGADRSLGIIASGVAFNYLSELFPDGIPFPTVRIGQYPLPKKMINRLADLTGGRLLVLEEGQPVIERSLRGLLDRGLTVCGRLSGEVVRDGELSPDAVRQTLLLLRPDLAATIGDGKPAFGRSEVVVPRPPALCQGCSHRDVYAALNAALATFGNPKVFGDIGCYTLGWLAPFNAIDSCVDMGASITMAKGAADAGQHPAVAIIGDSTFTHSGMTGLLDAVNENTPMTVIISDNLTTGMTGGQDSQGTGKIEEICLGLGVDPKHLLTIDALPRNVEDMTAAMLAEISYPGLSVIVSRRECIQTARRHASSKSK